MEDNRYKSCAISIVVIILVILAILVWPLLFSSCRAHKVASQEATQVRSVQTVTDSASETASRVHWLTDLHLDMDSFSMFILPLPMDSARADSCTLFDQLTRRPHSQANMVVLTAKHASLGKTDYVERNASRSTQQHAASSDTSSLAVQQYKNIDTTGIAEPPNMNWVLTLAIVIAAAVLLSLAYWRLHKK